MIMDFHENMTNLQSCIYVNYHNLILCYPTHRLYDSITLCGCTYELTHWDRVRHICISILIIIGSYNGLSPGRCQAIIWNDAGILLIEPLGTNLRKICRTYSRKCILKCCQELGSHLVSASMCYRTPGLYYFEVSGGHFTLLRCRIYPTEYAQMCCALLCCGCNISF